MNERKHIRTFEQYGLPSDQYLIKKQEWRQNVGNDASIVDFVWAMYNELLTHSSNDYHRQKMLYYEMVIFLSEENRDTYIVNQQVARMELLYLQQNDIERVKILTTGAQACKKCQKLEGKELSLKEALEQMPIPCKACTSHYGFCRCTYIAVHTFEW